MHDHLRIALSDRYLVEREVGRGGMASVWLAQDLRHARAVAIKVLHPELAGAVGVDRFAREIRVTAKLQHPNIVPILDSGVIEAPGGSSLPWYAMPYIAGESLRTRLDREGELPIDEAIRITADVADALMAAHRQGVVHRDIKPGNLLLADGQVYVADFGVAKALLGAGEHLTSTGVAIGTLAYMSPEQSTAGTVDPRSDQYSLACVLFEMLVGDAPFASRNPHVVVARRLAEAAPSVRAARSSVPPGVEAALLRAMQRVPSDRHADVAAFAAALREGAASVPPFHRRGWKVLASGAAATVALLAAIGWGVAVARGRSAEPAVRSADIVALYERGVRQYDERTPAGIIDAVDALAAAVGRDSTYAEAWAALANAYSRAFERAFALPGLDGDSILALAIAAADRALALDRNNAQAWHTLGIVSRQIDPTDVQPTMRAVERSLALDPSNAAAWHLLAVSQAESGDLETALTSWQRSVSADPSYTQGLAFMGLGYYWRRQFELAAPWADSALAIDPTYLLARTAVGQIAIELGDDRRADAAFDAADRLARDVESVNTLAFRAAAQARRGAADEARSLLREAESLAVAYVPAPLHTAAYMAAAYAELGDADRALEWVRRYSPLRNVHYQLHLRCDGTFVQLEDDPRFAALLVIPRPKAPAGC